MTNFIIVDSVKGGCGKTTEALAEAFRSASKINKKHKVCVIDMDLLGTSMERLFAYDGFIKNTSFEFLNAYQRASLYLNDLIDNDYNEEYISSIKITPRNVTIENIEDAYEKDGYDIDFIMSSPDYRDKRKFKASGDSNYTIRITPTHFRGIIKKIVDRLIDDGYETVIFDMPPNTDPYSECVFDLLLDISYRNDRNDKISSVNLIIVSSYDTSHVYANTEWLKSLCEGKLTQRKLFDKITVLLNNNSIDDSNNNEMLIKARAIKKSIVDSLPKSIYTSRIEYVCRKYNESLSRHFFFESGASFTDFSKVDKSWLNTTNIDDNIGLSSTKMMVAEITSDEANSVH